MAALHVTFTIKVPIEIIKRNNVYVACCPILDVNSQGENEANAIENIKDAIQLFLISCFERGVLDKALKERGFTPQHEPFHKESPLSHIITIDVPLYLIKSDKVSEICHA